MAATAEYSDQVQKNRDEFYSWRGMHEEQNAEDLIRSHQSVVQYWKSYNDRRERMYDLRKGNHWTEEELQVMRDKRKAPVVFNKIVTSVRSIVGNFIQNKYDIAPAPREPTDQDVSDVLRQRYLWNTHHTEVAMKDPEMIQEAVVGGDAWQESWVEVSPGGKPRIMVTNQNNHAIYPDPNSRDIVGRTDMMFIDRATWLNLGELMERWPEHAIKLNQELESFENDTDGSYEPEKKYANRTHESQYERNGRFLVIERFYRVWKKKYYGLTEEFEKVEIGLDDDGSKRERFRNKYPDYDIYSKSEEYLFLAVSVPVFRLTTFLSNEPYHNQPRDPVTGRIMYPLVQLVCESLDGETNGFVEYMEGPNRLINAMLSNKLHSAKHSVNNSLLANSGAFEETQLQDLEQHHSDGDRVFRTKKDADVSRAVSALPVTNTNVDTDKVLEYSDALFDILASTPPASKGVSEGNVPGILNEQRIQQAFIQLLGVEKNVKHFLTKRAKLWAYYDREYFTEEETFRVIEKRDPTDPDFLTINQPYVDEFGEIKKANDISTAIYDIVFEDSFQSPTTRDKVRRQIIELQQSPAVQQDPILNTMLTMYFFRLSDSPQDLKDFVYQHSQVLKQQAQNERGMDMQDRSIEQAERLNTLAQTRAEQEETPEFSVQQQGAGGAAPITPQTLNPAGQ